MSGKLDKNPSNFNCPHCKTEMPKRMSMTGQRGQLSTGMIFVCSACAGISVLGDSDLHPMTAEEFKNLHPATKRSLYITRTEIEQTIKAGGKWSPYTKN